MRKKSQKRRLRTEMMALYSDIFDCPVVELVDYYGYGSPLDPAPSPPGRIPVFLFYLNFTFTTP